MIPQISRHCKNIAKISAQNNQDHFSKGAYIMTENKNFTIASPVSGRVIALDEVPDQVFSDRILGDGCAVIPQDGKIYSPADGVITSVADAGHA